MKHAILEALLLLLLCASSVTGQIIYVDAGASPGGDGSSWGTAYKYLQDALYKPPSGGDQIWVAEGTYKPDGDEGRNVTPGDRTDTFQLINGVGIYGGFPAGGGERNPDTYITILSGDLNGDDDGFTNNGENSFHVVTGSGTEPNAVLDGFTITGGNANGVIVDHGGGGMYNRYGSPTVKNCTFSGNSARNGGGMYNSHSNPTVTGCTFSDNIANSGGGMENYNSGPTVTNCTFTGNSADSGGGMCNWDSSPVLTNCTFTGNTADYDGGGMYNYYESRPMITNCTFTGNTADYGGGMCNNFSSSPAVINCTFSDNEAYGNGGGMCNDGGSPTLFNCTFGGNSANGNGGGMYNDSSSPTVSNCTFGGNSANGNGGGMYNYYYSNAALTNCTFSGNSANHGGGMYSYGGDPVLTNCTFSGNSAWENGGGVHNDDSSPTVTNCIFSGNSAYRGGGMYSYVGDPVLTNCTFSGNVASGYGGGIYTPFGYIELTNCILWGNVDIGGTDESAQIYGGMTGRVRFSCIQDGYPNDTYIPFGGDYYYNIDDDPMFIREPNDGGDGWGVGNNDDFGDLHLRASSPCINVGDPDFLAVKQADIDGQPRIMGQRVDMGADEFFIQTLVVTKPEGGEVWAAGSRHEIKWYSYYVSETVDIRLSTDGGVSWPFIESGVPNSGSYKLQLPDINESNQSLISVVPGTPDPNVVCIESGLFTIQPYSPGPAVASRWKSLGGNFRRTGLSENYGPEVGCVQWQFDMDGPVSASVTVGANDRVHIASEDGKVYTLDANGVLLWSYDANSPLLSSPTIGPDGTVYVGSESGMLYAVDMNGSLRWTHPTGGPIYSSPALSADGNNIYVCSQDGILYALGQDGSKLWSFETNGPARLSGSILASPAISADGTIYIAGLYDPNLYALEPNDGSVKWNCSFEFPVEPGNPNSEMEAGWPFVSPVIGADGIIYQMLLYDTNLYAIEPHAGTIIWSTNLADPTSGWFDPDYAEECADGDAWSEPALGPDGTIYVSFDDPYLRAVDPNGSIKWVTRLGMIGGLTLTVGSDGLVYAAGDDGVLYVVDSNGCELARFQTDCWLSFPIIAAENTIIVSGINDNAVLTGDANSTIWAIKGYGCEDLNLDETVNFVDFALLAANWLNCTDPDYPCNYEGEELYFVGDIDEDKYVHFSDLAAIASKWLEDFKWLKPLPSPP